MAAAAAAAAAAPEAAPAAAAVPLPPKPWRAAVLGATGACGRHVVGALAKSADFESVTAFVRKRVEDGDLAARFYLESDAERAKVRQHALDFERMEEQKEAFQGYTHVFSCMGTTRSATSSDAEYRKIDLEFPLRAAQLFRDGGAQHLSLVTSAKASDASWSGYLKLKAELEKKCEAQRWPRLSIFRPGLILQDREGPRKMENMLQALWPNWMLPETWKALSAKAIGECMVRNSALEPKAATEFYEVPDMLHQRLGKST